MNTSVMKKKITFMLVRQIKDPVTALIMYQLIVSIEKLTLAKHLILLARLISL